MEDYEELMLQISDVMREANRVRPDLSHEQAIKNIRGIVERHGKWIESKEHFYTNESCKEWTNFYCSECDVPSISPSNFCPNCGAKMDL